MKLSSVLLFKFYSKIIFNEATGYIVTLKWKHGLYFNVHFLYICKKPGVKIYIYKVCRNYFQVRSGLVQTLDNQISRQYLRIDTIFPESQHKKDTIFPDRLVQRSIIFQTNDTVWHTLWYLAIQSIRNNGYNLNWYHPIPMLEHPVPI